MIQRMARYDDELWELVPADPGAPPAHILDFVRGLGHAGDVLDLGVGDGRVTAHVDAARLVGADTSQVALDRARPRLGEAELVRVDAEEPLPFEDTSFDLVTCIETMEHIRDVQMTLSEIRRVLRPGGRLAMTTPASGRLRVLLHGVEPPLSPHLHAFTKRSLRETIESMGFTVASLRSRRGTLLAVAQR